MATATTTLPRRRSGLSGRWLIGGIILVVVAIVAALLISGAGRRPAAAAVATTPVKRGNLVALVAGSGSVAAEQSLNLAFQANGTVAEVLVKEGDVVQTGQALARLDDRALRLQVTIAQSSLESARARLAQAQQGNARTEDLAASQAQVASAQASFDKASRGPSAPDLASAQASVRSAQAAYDAAVRSSENTGSQLEASAAALAKAEASLRQAQTAYDRVVGNANIGMLPQSLQLETATIDYQTAKANYTALNNTSSADAQSKVQSAAAQLALARANLAKLTPTKEDVAVAQAGLDSAKANLAKLTASGTATDLQIQQAAVAQAEGSLQQAKLTLDNATLNAPFGGVVADVNVVPGSTASAATSALRLINRSPLHVDLKLSENDVAQVQLDQPVSLVISSLGGWKTEGRVSYVAPAADTANGVVTYAVRVSFADNDPKVKVGMTADLSIVTARKENVLLVPNTALLPKGTGRVVQVPSTEAPKPGAAATQREIDVQTGLTDGTQTEIISGVTEGQQIITLPGNGVKRPMGGMFGG